MESDGQLTLDNIRGLKVIVGLTYYSPSGDVLMQRQLGGQVLRVDKQEGIMLKQGGDQHFVIPSDLRCWFTAPPGDYHDESGKKISDPDFLICWDIHQTQRGVEDQQHQWWEWVPCTVVPGVGEAAAEEAETTV